MKTPSFRREILPSGKSRAFVNDVPVTLDILKELSEKLVDIHSQFETSNLFSKGLSIQNYRWTFWKIKSDRKLSKDFSELLKLKKVEKLKINFPEGNKESDYKQFLLEELEAANLENVNYELLQSQISLAENKGTISELFAQIFARTDQDEVGVFDSLYDIKKTQ